MFQSICKGVIAVSLWLGVGANISSSQPPKEITNSIGMKLVLIPKGTFMMSSPEYEEGVTDYESQQHEVEISKDLYLGAFEVTQAQYLKVMGTNPSWFQKSRVLGSDSSRYPVDNVSWEDAIEFCKKLSDFEEEKKAGRVYRLPTEAEWAHACLAGSNERWSNFDEGNGNYGWFGGNSNRQTHPIGEKKPNAWGLYDMYGNVWEWCGDRSGAYPKGDRSGWFRVARGAAWDCGNRIRIRLSPTDRDRSLGFRVALSPSTSPQGGDELKR
ncbi:MAG: formylglycine-generating enzyme family protein [Planctomycetota bacterium]|jgi:formylglycine-generating enzyme required for sulfatase activity|nr:MAG: formylglycine-generating enzyme family protein [Planctomycetota bacterium]